MIRRWCTRFGPLYARHLRRESPRQGDVWLLDEVFLSIGGQRYYLWRAVDQDGDVIDILLQKRRNGSAAKCFFRKLMKGQQALPSQLVTDKLGSYHVAHRELMSTVVHDTTQYKDNRCEAAANETISPSCDGAAVLGAPRSGAKLDGLGPTPVKRVRLPPFSWEGIRGMVNGDVRLKSDELELFRASRCL